MKSGRRQCLTGPVSVHSLFPFVEPDPKHSLLNGISSRILLRLKNCLQEDFLQRFVCHTTHYPVAHKSRAAKLQLFAKILSSVMYALNDSPSSCCLVKKRYDSCISFCPPAKCASNCSMILSSFCRSPWLSNDSPLSTSRKLLSLRQYRNSSNW